MEEISSDEGEDVKTCFKADCPFTAAGGKEEIRQCGVCANVLHVTCGHKCACKDTHAKPFCSFACHSTAVKTLKAEKAKAKKQQKELMEAKKLAEEEEKKKKQALAALEEQIQKTGML